ncbi:PTS sugar transporter subunit IIA [Pectinatus sottacetonis]|uniref:PTS sugar transporter subunit IIA n=1 Tax=Pectinatus sottacetonis TaxID=1002795 RepID=UPI0018C76843|nr:PTS sugar transporter subunit IIA [Pectinatus sottacetonis]
MISPNSQLLNMNISLNNLFIDLDAESDMDAIKKMAVNFNKEGVVKKSFIGAVLEREKKFCTGLQFDEAGIAIPHTDVQHVNLPAISIAVLKKPLVFREMGMPDTKINVEIVFMLAIKTAHGQVEFLQTLMTAFQKKGILKSLIKSESKIELLNKFKNILGK